MLGASVHFRYLRENSAVSPDLQGEDSPNQETKRLSKTLLLWVYFMLFWAQVMGITSLQEPNIIIPSS